MTYDGDNPGDRTIIVGQADGALRQWDRYADDDDGMPIGWSVTCGPIHGAGLAGGGRMATLHVVSSGVGDFQVAPWAVDRLAPEVRARPLSQHTLVAGQAGGVTPTASGAFLFVTLFGTSRVTIQSLVAGVVPAGRTKR